MYVLLFDSLASNSVDHGSTSPSGLTQSSMQTPDTPRPFHLTFFSPIHHHHHHHHHRRRRRRHLAVTCGMFRFLRPAVLMGICRGADKSLARPGRKQARKHVRDMREFNNMRDASCHQDFFFPARQGTEGN